MNVILYSSFFIYPAEDFNFTVVGVTPSKITLPSRFSIVIPAPSGVVLNATGYFVAVKIVAQEVSEAINAQSATSLKIFISLELCLILLKDIINEESVEDIHSSDRRFSRTLGKTNEDTPHPYRYGVSVTNKVTYRIVYARVRSVSLSLTS